MKLLVLLTLLLAVDAGTVYRGRCVVSEWTDWWSARDDHSHNSYPADGHRPDAKQRRQAMMTNKDKLGQYRETCIHEGTCPEVEFKATEGFVPCVNGFINSTTSEPIPCLNIDQVAFMNFDDLLHPGTPGAYANDVWGWTDPLTAVEYVIQGMDSGATFIDIQDPSNPVAVAFLPTATVSSTWRDIKVVNDWAFVVSEAADHGIQGFDLSRLRSTPPGSTVTADYTLGNVGNCHNIAGNQDAGKVYAVGCTDGTHCAEQGGLFIVDVSDPANPVLPSDNTTNCFDGDGYIHDAQCVVYNGPDAEHAGKDICFCYNEDTMTIVDVDIADDIQMLSRTGYTGSSYTHQGWLTDDHTIVVMDDEEDPEDPTTGELSTFIWDVTNLDAPVLMNTYYHGVQSRDHNQYVRGDLTYQANYMTGLAILRIDQAAFSLNKVAYFDTYPAADGAEFNGSWSVYPFFSSGNIALSSTDYGMYIVRYTGSGATQPSAEHHRYRSVLTPGDGNCPVLSDTQK